MQKNKRMYTCTKYN